MHRVRLCNPGADNLRSGDIDGSLDSQFAHIFILWQQRKTAQRLFFCRFRDLMEVSVVFNFSINLVLDVSPEIA